MASLINADNGVVSGTAGVKTTADTSGELALQSNGVTGLTINTSLAIGVGSGNSTGANGQVLTSSGSGAAPTWSAVESIGTGGATATGSVTLTASSPAMQSVLTTTYGQSVTLPDATTLQKGVTVFGVFNSGEYPLLINNSAGTLLGFTPVNGYVICSLVDNSDSSGNWALSGHDVFGVDASIAFGPNTGTNPTLAAVVLDSDRRLLVLSTSVALYGVVYNQATQTFGSSTLLRNVPTSANVAVGLHAADTVLLVSCQISSTALEAVVLSIGGETITVNTAAVATLASTSQNTGFELEKVGTTWLLGYTRTGPACDVRVISISGATCTIGGATAQNATSGVPQIYALTSSTAIVFAQDAAGLIRAMPVTISGTTATNGSEGYVNCTAIGFATRLLDSGRIAVICVDTNLTGAIVSVSGTTASTTSVQLGTGAVAISATSVNKVGNQCIVVAGSSTASVNSINILTDSGGTAVAGTAINATASGTINFAYAGFENNRQYGFLYKVNNSQLTLFSVGINGNNPDFVEHFFLNESTSYVYNVSSARTGGSKYEYESVIRFLQGANFSGCPLSGLGFTQAVRKEDALFPALTPISASETFYRAAAESAGVKWGASGSATSSGYFVQRMRAV